MWYEKERKIKMLSKFYIYEIEYYIEEISKKCIRYLEIREEDLKNRFKN